ncbi:hypothetical protein [Bacteroides sp. 519]|uniref:hypothetical protein n=1 Tax=Bacteroides sp. 519 TaxID=2302937 RepID=UPI0013D781AF|nr:hypothetical protein [Bacteroides sp. 519]NDV57381.1 hypothetical protein [Bacteroides sp. 519]
MRTCNLYLFVFFLFTCISCTDISKEVEPQLVHSQIDFTLKTSCVSSSRIHNDTYFIGFDAGGFAILNRTTNEQRIVKTRPNRIYDILEESDSTFWLGVRNEGLIWIKIRDYKVIEEKQYSIKLENYIYEPNPITSYATYSITEDQGSLFLATSSGAYLLTKDDILKGDTLLKKIYRPDTHTEKHYRVNKILVKGKDVFCATETGLILADTTRTETKETPIKREILHLYESKDTLYASSQECRYVFDMKSKTVIDSIPVSSNEKYFAYIRPDAEVEWKLFSNKITFKNNNGKCSLKMCSILSSNYKNFIYEGEDFILITCNHTLYILSKHQNPLGDSNHVIAAIKKDDNQSFFITKEGRLHSFDCNTAVSNPVGILTGFDTQENIVDICLSPNYLWAITSKRLYKIDCEKHKATILGENKDYDFKSLAYFDDRLYVGSRKFLYAITNPDKNKKFDTIRTEPTIDYSNLYITDIVKRDSIYVSSLTKGVFRLHKDTLLSIPNSDFETIGSVQQMQTSQDKLYLLTNKGIYLKEKNAITLLNSTSTTKAIINNNNLLIGNTGIGCRDNNNVLHQFSTDLTFSDVAIVPNKYNENGLIDVFLGSSGGLYRYNLVNHKLQAITITPSTQISWIVIVSVVVGVLVIIGLILLFRSRAKADTKQQLEDALFNKIREAFNKKDTKEVEKLGAEFWAIHLQLRNHLKLSLDQQTIAVIYLAFPGIKPNKVANVIDRDSNYVSDDRRKINIQADKMKNKDLLCNKLYKSTLSTRQLNEKNSDISG